MRSLILSEKLETLGNLSSRAVLISPPNFRRLSKALQASEVVETWRFPRFGISACELQLNACVDHECSHFPFCIRTVRTTFVALHIASHVQNISEFLETCSCIIPLSSTSLFFFSEKLENIRMHPKASFTRQRLKTFLFRFRNIFAVHTKTISVYTATRFRRAMVTCNKLAWRRHVFSCSETLSPSTRERNGNDWKTL